MADHRLRSSWSELLPELLQPIFNLLQTRPDILSFCAVCSNWRKNSAPPSPNIISPLLPRQIPSSDNPIGISDGSRPLVVSATSVFLVTPIFCNQPSWLVMAEELNPGKLQLRHPVTGKLFNHSRETMDLADFKEIYGESYFSFVVMSFDDIVSFRGMIVGVEPDGSLYVFEYESGRSNPLLLERILVKNPHLCFVREGS